MNLDDWIKKYNSKTEEPFKRDYRFLLCSLPEKGFCEIGKSQEGNMYIINQLCGDARYWKSKVDEVARKTGVKMCGTWCIRPEIYAYIRLFGYKIIEDHELEDGSRKIIAVHKKTGKKGWVSPGYRYTESGHTAYLVTWEP